MGQHDQVERRRSAGERDDVQGTTADEEYGEMIGALRDLLDTFAGARPDAETIAQLTGEFRSWTQTLAPSIVDEIDQPFGHRPDLPGHGQSLTPLFIPMEQSDQAVRGRVTFGRYFLGEHGAVHGGVLPLLLEEVLGRLARSGSRTPSRTAYLNVNFRAPTPVDVPLELSAWFVGEDGRKRVIRGEIRHGGTLCVDAEGLFLGPRPTSPGE